MFAFLPVGGPTALVGVVFLSFIGWKLIPVREGQASPDDLFHIEDYLVEVRVPENSEFIDQPIAAIPAFHETDTAYVGLSRGEKKGYGHDFMRFYADKTCRKCRISILMTEISGRRRTRCRIDGSIIEKRMKSCPLYIETTGEYTAKSSKKKSNYRLDKEIASR